MTNFARIDGKGIVLEIIEPFIEIAEAHVTDEGTEVPRIEREVPIAERFHPDFVAHLVPVPEGQVIKQGDSYVDGAFGPPPTEPPMTAVKAGVQRDALLTQAALFIEPLRDAVELGMATEVEKAALAAWQAYRIKLRRLEQQPGFPTAIDWPEVPA